MARRRPSRRSTLANSLTRARAADRRAHGRTSVPSRAILRSRWRGSRPRPPGWGGPAHRCAARCRTRGRGAEIVDNRPPGLDPTGVRTHTQAHVSSAISRRQTLGPCLLAAFGSPSTIGGARTDERRTLMRRCSIRSRPRSSASPGCEREIGRAIFGQERVIEESLITLLAGGHVLLVGVPGLAKTRLVETLGMVLGLSQKRVQFTPDLMPADILGSEVLEEGETRQAQLPLHPGPGLLPAADGRRDQPRQPAHPVGAAAGDAGAPGHRRRPRPRPARAVPRARDPEPDRAGGHLSRCPRRSSTASCCRSTSTIPDRDAERRMLIETTGAGERAGDAGDDRRGADRRCSTWCGACRSASRWSTRSSRWSAAGRPASSPMPDLARADRLGPGPARQPGADADRARARAAGRPPAPRRSTTCCALAAPVLRHRMALTFAARADGVTLDQVIERLTPVVAD